MVSLAFHSMVCTDCDYSLFFLACLFSQRDIHPLKIAGQENQPTVRISRIRISILEVSKTVSES